MYSDDVVFRVTIVIEKDEDAFHAYCPELNGLHICGETEDEAFLDARHAVVAYLRTMLKHGERIPSAIVHYKPKRRVLKPRVQRRTETVNLALSFA